MKAFQKFSNTGLSFLWVALIVVIVDRTTKILAQYYLFPFAAWPIFPGFNLTLAYNKGAAFSFLNSAAGWQTWLFGTLSIIISIVLLVWLARTSRKNRLIAIALSLIIGGALGNLWDRISYGQVVDFIDLYVKNFHWPVFNIADSAICVGAILLIVEAVFTKKS